MLKDILQRIGYFLLAVMLLTFFFFGGVLSAIIGTIVSLIAVGFLTVSLLAYSIYEFIEDRKAASTKGKKSSEE